MGIISVVVLGLLAFCDAETPTACRNVTGSAGGFVTDGSGEYPSSEELCWHIFVAPGQRVSLSFEFINLESSYACQADYVGVFDGTSASAPLLAKLCGTALPDPVISTSNSLYIRLHTDGSIQGTGFVAWWNGA